MRCRPIPPIVSLLLVSGCGSDPATAPPGQAAGEPIVEAIHLGGLSPGTRSDPDKVRTADVSILFVGNSHTVMHNLPTLVCEMIRFRHPEKSTYVHVITVAFLEDAARDPACRDEIDSRAWKHVILQAQKISVSGKHDYPRQDGIDLARLAKSRGAGVVFYPEWGLRGRPGDGERQEKVYREMAAAAEVRLAPVASAWDLALAERPGLALHDADGNHQSALGAFLTAAVLFGRLTGESPATLAAFPYTGASDDDRRFIADVAAKAIAQEPQKR